MVRQLGDDRMPLVRVWIHYIPTMEKATQYRGRCPRYPETYPDPNDTSVLTKGYGVTPFQRKTGATMQEGAILPSMTMLRQ